VACAQCVHRIHNPSSFVGNYADLGKPDALLVQPQCDLRDILVLSPSRQDLIADHEQRGSPDAFTHH